MSREGRESSAVLPPSEWKWSVYPATIQQRTVPLGMPSLRCSFSKLLNVSSTAWDIFWRVRGVRGGILVSMATTSPGPSKNIAHGYYMSKL